jgi:hypothetical protein
MYSEAEFKNSCKLPGAPSTSSCPFPTIDFWQQGSLSCSRFKGLNEGFVSLFVT